MRHSFLLGTCLLGGALAPGVLAACGLSVSGDGPSGTDASLVDASEASAPDTSRVETGITDSGVIDSAAEASTLDSSTEAGCVGVVCNGACVPASDCRSCSGAPLLCAPEGRCAATCQGCTDTSGTAMPIECFACDSTLLNPIGTCQYDDAGSYCLSGDYMGQYEGGPGYQCSCSSVSACPGATQVCVQLGHQDASFCLTCGEATIGVIQGQPCKGGGACQESTATCQ